MDSNRPLAATAVCFIALLICVQSRDASAPLAAYQPSNRTLLPHFARQKPTGAFVDASHAFGITGLTKRLKYGGAVLADLDGNGWLDILISHHVQYAELFFNDKGVFTKANWNLYQDLHGLLPVRSSPRKTGMHFIASRGGGRGNNLKPPTAFLVSPSRSIKNVSGWAGFNSALGRGRSATALRMNLDAQSGRRYDLVLPDVLFTHALGKNDGTHHDALEGTRRRVWEWRNMTGFKPPNGYAFVSDIRNVNQGDVITWPELTVHRLTGSFQFTDVSASVLPKNIDLSGVVAVAELDMDNDGDMDLVVTRSDSGTNSWLTRARDSRKFIPGDYLFRNDNGRYVDVSMSSGIRKVMRNGNPGTGSRGVTVGDFDNDGNVDIIIVGFASDDIDAILWNNGDGTFTVDDPGFNRSPNVAGDHPVAADVNRDGRLEIVLSEGDWHDVTLAGNLRIMKLSSDIGRKIGNSILVRVGNSPLRLTTSLHATVVVHLDRGKKLLRKVSSPGTCVSNSYIDTVHFGIGAYDTVKSVTVTWSNGEVARRWNVSKRFIYMGNFASLG